MTVRAKRLRRVGGGPRRGGPAGVSPRALYARPLALRRLYTDAGSITRTGQWDAVVEHGHNSR